MPQGQFTSADIQQAPVVTGRFTAADIDSSASAPNKAGVTRFLERYTGLPVEDIIDNPGKYVDVFGKDYWQAAKDNRNQPIGPDLSRGNPMIPGHQTMLDIKDRKWPEVTADVLQAAPLIAPFAGKAATAARPAIARTAEVTGQILQNPIIGAIEPHLPHAGKILERMGTALKPRVAQPTPTPALTAAEATEGESWREPENVEPTALEQAKARFQAAQQQQTPVKPAYPEGMNKAPRDRAEITSDKAIEDAMRNNLEKQGWQALSQERKEFYANNQPGMSKGDLVTNARVEAVRTAAEQEVQKILAESNRPVKFTKTVIPKAKTAAAQPLATGDPNTDLVDILQRSIDAVNARKGNK